mmetsp:Transcript_12388/g.33433  ORF Transcript_12388/g.33433 Transcript_12388/m.33433 type:complete len:222 (+) Transcript_12388:431-1096(+)
MVTSNVVAATHNWNPGPKRVFNVFPRVRKHKLFVVQKAAVQHGVHLVSVQSATNKDDFRIALVRRSASAFLTVIYPEVFGLPFEKRFTAAKSKHAASLLPNYRQFLARRKIKFATRANQAIQRKQTLRDSKKPLRVERTLASIYVTRFTNTSRNFHHIVARPGKYCAPPRWIKAARHRVIAAGGQYFRAWNLVAWRANYLRKLVQCVDQLFNFCASPALHD